MSLAEAIARFAPQAAPFEAGHVLLAGAGPGCLGCLTLDVVAALATADAVVYDALVDPVVLKAAVNAELYFVGKRATQPSASQEYINCLLARLSREGKRVLRLKGGDPNVFGRGGEEAFSLVEAGVPFRFLPGITSGLGALASVGIPATLRGINKAIILATGHAAGTENDLDWAALTRTGQPIVIYMGMNNLAAIAGALTAGGLPDTTPAAIIISATTPTERVLTTTLGAIVEQAEAAGLGSPGLIVIGDIVPLREGLAPRSSIARPA